jgi:hypothetical protein
MENNNSLIIICVVILVGVIVYFCLGKKSSFTKGTVENKDKDIETDVQIETFLNTGGLDNLGALLPNQYDLVQSPDQKIAATEFADLVSDQSDLALREAKQPVHNGANMKPMERLSGIQGQSLMPRTSENITPYSVQLGNPKSFKFSTNQARVQLKPRLWEADLYSMTRGSVPITYNRNVPLISVSQYGRDNQNFAGMFSCGAQALYDKYTGNAYRSMPVLTAGSGQAGGYGGASSETIMDNYV